MKRYIRSSKGEYIDEVDGVKIYWDSDDGVAYIYTEPHGKRRMEFSNRGEAEIWITENMEDGKMKVLSNKQAVSAASSNVLLTSDDGLFELVVREGVGVERTPWRGLQVNSLGAAEKHVVEIRLNQNNADFNGEPVDLSYYGVYVGHGMRGRADTLEDTAEFIEVMQSALDFAYEVRDYMAANGWME